MRARLITQDDIARAAQSRVGQEMLCEQVAVNLKEGAPSERFTYNAGAVFMLRPRDAGLPDQVILLYSWTITGQFVQCRPTLDVTAYATEYTEVHLDSVRPPGAINFDSPES